MEFKLDSCPFCGRDDIYPSFVRGYQAGNLSQPIISAGCMDCGALGKIVNVPDHSTGYAEAAEAWNSRAPSDLEIVQKALDKKRASIEIWSNAGSKAGGLNAQSLLTWAKQTIGEE